MARPGFFFITKPRTMKRTAFIDDKEVEFDCYYIEGVTSLPGRSDYKHLGDGVIYTQNGIKSDDTKTYSFFKKSEQ